MGPLELYAAEALRFSQACRLTMAETRRVDELRLTLDLQHLKRRVDVVRVAVALVHVRGSADRHERPAHARGRAGRGRR